MQITGTSNSSVRSTVFYIYLWRSRDFDEDEKLDQVVICGQDRLLWIVLLLTSDPKRSVFDKAR